jgi:high-affinity iron transporter
LTIESISWAAFAPAVLLGVREGLEAALVLGIVLGLLHRTGNLSFARYVWAGAAAAGVLSLLVAALLFTLGRGLEGAGEAIFEGTMMALAAGLLTWMIFWMQGQGRTMRANLEGEFRRALTQRQRWGLAGLAFVAVAREGLELALFLTAAALSTSEGLAALGWRATAVQRCSAGVVYITVRTDLRRFFDLSGALLLLFAAGLVAHGVHEFNEVRWIPALVEPLWNVNGILNESSPLGEVLKALLGYNGNPSLSEVLAYVVYLGGVAMLLLRRRARPRPAAPAAAVEGA